MVSAVLTKDLDGYVGFFAEDGVEVPPGGEPIGKAAYRTLVAAEMADPAFAAAGHPIKAVAAQAGDLVYVLGTWETTLTSADGVPVTTRGRYLTLWREQPDGQYRIALDIYNVGPVAP